MSRPALALGAYVVVSVVHVLSRLFELSALSSLTKPLLMPLLAAYLVLAVERPLPRIVRVTLIALAFSWLGDVLLMGSGEIFFLAGLGAFLAAQVSYIVAFTPFVRAGSPGRPPLWALVYVLYGAAMVAVLAPEVGELLVPVAVYAAALCTMAIVAAGVNRWTALGGLLFLISDTVLAATRFDVLDISSVTERVVVMSTYTAAQGLLVGGIVAAVAAAPVKQAAAR